MSRRPSSQKAPLPTGRMVLLGEFGRAVGLKGEVRLKSLTDDPLAIADYGPLFAEDGRSFVILSGRQVADNVLVVKLQDVTTREAAEALNRLKLSVPRTALPEAAEDEFYHADLIGLAVEDEAGKPIGRIVAIFDHGSGDVLEIRGESGIISIPFTKERAPVVDLAGGRVVVRP